MSLARCGVGALLALGVLALGGCGLGAGPAPTAVSLTVTRDFGETVLPSLGPLTVQGQETVMSLLMRNYRVSTRYSGGYVQSIDALAGGHEAGQPVDWFYYVNGLLAPKGAAATNVSPGDRIWWDRHDWSQTEEVPAVVGSFPEPFLNGYGGKRLPVRVECAAQSQGPCQIVAEHLQDAGVPAAVAGFTQEAGTATLRVVVGPWSTIENEGGAQTIEHGPRSSGVYARMSRGGAGETLLDENGRAVASLTSDAGLIAATRYREEPPVWFVSGTDEAGVELAAHDFDETALHDHFALALVPGRTIPLPDGG